MRKILHNEPNFENLSELHFPLLLRWLNAPHVKKWWDQNIIWNADLVKNKYSTYVKHYKLVNGQQKPIYPYIIKLDDKPVGYIQLYNVHDYHSSPELKNFPEQLPAIDMYIGEPDYLKKGIGTRALSAFISRYASKMGNTIFLAADIDNTAALKMYQSCGFKELKQVENEIWMLCNLNLVDVMRIHCQEPWFSKIRDGIKTVEGRKYNRKYHNLKSGDLLEFYCDDESFLTEVIEVKFYKTLEEYLEIEGYKNVLPGINSFSEAVAVYLQYNSREDLNKAGGFIGIHIKVKH